MADDDTKVRKIISGKVLLSLLKVAESNSEEVASINGEFRNDLKTHQDNGLNLKAWPSYRAVARARKRSSADALRLIEDIELGLAIIREDIEKQGDMLADQATGAASTSEESEKADETMPPDPDAEAAAKNTAALAGIKAPKESQSSKAERKRQEAQGAADAAVGKVIGEAARGNRFNRKRSDAPAETAH